MQGSIEIFIFQPLTKRHSYIQKQAFETCRDTQLTASVATSHLQFVDVVSTQWTPDLPRSPVLASTTSEAEDDTRDWDLQVLKAITTK